MEKDHTLDHLLRTLYAAPKARQAEVISSALALLHSKRPTAKKRLLYNAVESARELNMSTQSFWRLRKSGALQGVILPGFKFPRYRLADLERLAAGVEVTK